MVQHVAATETSPALVALLVVLAVVELGLLAWALVDLYRRPASQVNGGSKIPWLILCLLLQLIGPVVYLAVGREKPAPAAAILSPGAAVPPPLEAPRAEAAAVIDTLFTRPASAGRRRVLRPGRRARRRAQDLRRRRRARRPHPQRAGRLHLRLPRAQRGRQDDDAAHPRRARARGRRGRQDPGTRRRRRRRRRAQPDRLPPRRPGLLQVDDGARVPALRRQPVRPLRQRAGRSRRRDARARRTHRGAHARRRASHAG